MAAGDRREGICSGGENSRYESDGRDICIANALQVGGESGPVAHEDGSVCGQQQIQSVVQESRDAKAATTVVWRMVCQE